MHPGANTGHSWCMVFGWHAAGTGAETRNSRATRLRRPTRCRERSVVREAERVERLAYTRSQAAEALGISPSTFNRRLFPLIETVSMPSGRSLIPVDELERLLAQHRQGHERNLAGPRPPAASPVSPPR